MPRLPRCQDDFANALFERSDAACIAPELALLGQRPAVAVDRNCAMTDCIDALRVNYPSVARLAGDEWFRTLAARYARANPSARPTLPRYGQDFERFLATFEPVKELPYLPGVARLDRYWTEAHMARDEAPVDPHALAALDDASLSQQVLRLHASARWYWFDTHPVFTIWRRSRAPLPRDESRIDWHGEGALVVRTHGVPRGLGLNAAGCAFLATCADGGTLGEAASAALQFDANVEPAALVGPLLDAGVFVWASKLCSPSEEDPS